MKTVISVIHATRGRPAKALAVRADFLAKATEPERVQYILVADRDDEATLGAVPPHELVVGPPDGCAAAYNLGCLAADGDVFVLAADDVEPPFGWDASMLSRLGDLLLPRVLAVSDGHRADRLMAHPILTRARWEAQGRHVFDPAYDVAGGMYADCDFTEAAYRDGVVIEARDLVFEHQHPAFGCVEWDEQYLRQNAPARFVAGYEVFRRKFPNSSFGLVKPVAVWDCFIFFNELDLLEIRLNELEGIVDRHVIVEATRTFTGKRKPLHFLTHKSEPRFAKFAHKIIHVVAELDAGSPWDCERQQRDGILAGLGTARSDDMVLVSDADEIPRASAVVQALKEGLETFALLTPLLYFRFNVRNVAGETMNPTVVGLRRRLLASPHDARKGMGSYPVIFDGGWHFSHLGSVDRIREKIEACSHVENNTDAVKARLGRAVEEHLDPYERPGYLWRRVDLDESFPRYLVEQQERWRGLMA